MDYIDQIIVFHVLIIISLSKEPKKKGYIFIIC